MTAICRIFPRETNSYFGRVERSFSMGCEKVLELLLEEKEGLYLEEGQNHKVLKCITMIMDYRKEESNQNSAVIMTFRP